MATKNIEVIWTETTTYTRTFDVVSTDEGVTMLEIEDLEKLASRISQLDTEELLESAIETTGARFQKATLL